MLNRASTVIPGMSVIAAVGVYADKSSGATLDLGRRGSWWLRAAARP
jgi:hypothetical protein